MATGNHENGSEFIFQALSETPEGQFPVFNFLLIIYLFIIIGNVIIFPMSYDRYVAICDPLHYITRMSKKHCAWLISTSYCVGFVGSVGHVVLISKLSYCNSHIIDHFFCDLIPLLKLSCSDTFNVEILTYIIGTLFTFNSFLFTLISYIYIISAILKIQSTHGHQKAFSTCASHLTCVIILYMTLICLYMKPTTSYSLDRDKFFSLLYIVLVPLLNPLIYTLKNKEFLIAFNKLRQRGIFIKLQEKVVKSSAFQISDNSDGSMDFQTGSSKTKLCSFRDLPLYVRPTTRYLMKIW
ncbi:hypothetical protein GDO86_013577 [Hymenochirus boettgeri]|uniref:G-protein coupled receptors family 1 profile domain-containing protein n=1 Tax=Hymenochirus boettgeri TaxID=247094 RepID=A0A8T2IX88_9PIPI|nr:hypothetical protein GDO86_013577 [Hymenochirus boettgeri]